MTEAKQAFWGLIELMGHAKIAGLVSEVEMGGAKLLRVDVPDMPEQPPQGWRDASPKIKPLRGEAFTAFLRKCAETVDKWPHWIKGEKMPKKEKRNAD